MPEPRLISSYLDVLAAQLPASIVEELADGLTETHQSYLRQGLAPDLAARSAVAEFGEPQVIVAGFARVNPARRAARRLLGVGPAVGACWVAALLTSRSWAVPLPARMLAGATLAVVIALLATCAGQALPPGGPRRRRGIPRCHRARRLADRQRGTCRGATDLGAGGRDGGQRRADLLRRASRAPRPGRLRRARPLRRGIAVKYLLMIYGNQEK